MSANSNVKGMAQKLHEMASKMKAMEEELAAVKAGQTSAEESPRRKAHGSKVVITEEQRTRMERNRKRALELRDLARKRQRVGDVGSSRCDSAGKSSSPTTKPFSRNIVAEQAMTTLCPAIDEILEGGLVPDEILELYGPSASGKTQLTMQMATSALLSSESAKAVYIDTYGTFRPSRILEIARGRGGLVAKGRPGEAKLLDRLSVGRPCSQAQLLGLLNALSNPPKSLKLVCVDSIINFYRAASAGDARSNAKSTLTEVMEKISALAKAGVRVCIVNEATADFTSNGTVASSSINSFKPVGGNRITKYLTCRLRLKKKSRPSSHYRIARMGSDGQVVSEDEFDIKTEGIFGVGEDVA